MNGAFCLGKNVRLGHKGGKSITPVAIDFSFPEGKLTALVGKNGSGKTSLLRAILGESTCLSGEIFLKGISGSLSRISPRELSQTLAFVPQEHRFPAELLVVDLMRFAFLPRLGILGRLPREQDPEIQEVLTAFQLGSLSHRPLKAISTGERQKVFLARALLQRPKILLLDEPTNHLDPGAIYSFWTALMERKRLTQLEIVVATHDLAFVRRHADWIYALESGQVRFEGTRDVFFREDTPKRIFGETL